MSTRRIEEPTLTPAVERQVKPWRIAALSGVASFAISFAISVALGLEPGAGLFFTVLLFALPIAGSTILEWLHWKRASSLLLMLLLVSLGLGIMGLLGFALVMMLERSELPKGAFGVMVGLALFGFCIWLIAGFVRGAGGGPEGRLSLLFVVTILIFVCVIVLGGQKGMLVPGLVAFFGTTTILAGILGEARLLTRDSWLGVLGKTLTCRLEVSDMPRGFCPACDYHLYGLSEARCPECGRPFTFEEIGATPEEMAFGESMTPSGESRR